MVAFIERELVDKLDQLQVFDGVERLGAPASHALSPRFGRLSRPDALVSRIASVVVGGNGQCGVAETSIFVVHAFTFKRCA